MWPFHFSIPKLCLLFYLFICFYGACANNETDSSSILEVDVGDQDAFTNILKVNEREHVIDDLFEGDIVLPQFRNAHGKQWHKSTDGYVRVPYTIQSEYTPEHRRLIQSAMNVFAQHTCIRFVPKAPEHRSYVSIENNAGCSSAVGRLFAKQSVSLSIPSCLKKGVVIHELMHAIGFQHEQSRSDRNNYVNILEENVRNSLINFKKYGSTQNLVIYDYGSIMHYGRHAFAKYAFLKTIEVKPHQRPEPSMGQREQMSPYDIEEIKYYYECGANTYKRCGQDFDRVSTGSFQSPRYPRSYPAEAHCTWKITVRPGRFASILFSNINVQSSRLCEDDAIIVHNGPNAGYPVLAKICGNHGAYSLTSTQQHLFVIFRSDGKQSNDGGFQATFNEGTTKGNIEPSLVKPEPQIPTVFRFSHTFQCDFDVSMCQMTHDNLDDRDFTRRADPTPTRGTGPSKDHTSGKGQFIYLEASGANVGDIGIIRSPWFKNKGPLCVTFSYHMYGAAMGGLQIYSYEKRMLSNVATTKFLWGKFRNQGDKWHTQAVTYRPEREVEHMQFYWEGTIYQDLSDIALDDISITPGSCFVEPTVPVVVYPSRFCNFEVGLCGFQQPNTDVFDWSRSKGPTTTQNTGPSRDHTSGRGFFMYADGSRGRNNVARLVSPPLTVQPHCLKLWYHMNGKNMGKLRVYREHKGRNIKMAEIIGSQGDEWKQLAVTIAKATSPVVINDFVQDAGADRRRAKRSVLRSTNYVKVVVEATIGNGSLSDIAIDDVTITSTRCDPAIENGNQKFLSKFSCDFESNFGWCGLKQLGNDNFDWTRHQGPTRSRGTGPSTDNTLKTAAGHYIYTEASGRVLYDIAKIKTPELRAGQYCVRFDYHMHGQSMGLLEVFAIEHPGRKASSQWRKIKNQGNQWITASFEYSSGAGYTSLEFMFQATLGTSYSGDMAIDNLNIVQGRCGATAGAPSLPASTPQPTSIYSLTSPGLKPAKLQPQEIPTARMPTLSIATTRRPVPETQSTTIRRITQATTIRPPPVVQNGLELWAGMPLCTFEAVASGLSKASAATPPGRSKNDLGAYQYPSRYANDRMCGWRQFRAYDQFDWTLHTGPTQSQNTGPSGDKTTGRGHYLYIETSKNKPYDAANLQTYFMPSTDYCININYHMFGSSVGSLSVRLVEFDRSGSRFRPLLKTIEKSQGNRWHHTTIDFTPSADSQRVAFRLEGVVGNGRRGDIAIDDLAVMPGGCDVCRSPQFHHDSQGVQRHFATGCVHSQLFWVRCCSSSKPKAVYRRVKKCGKGIFKAARLDWYCRNL